jgi:DNA repair protein RadD
MSLCHPQLIGCWTVPCEPLKHDVTQAHQGHSCKTAPIAHQSHQRVTSEKQNSNPPGVTSSNGISQTVTDWTRAEDLYEALTAHVGVPDTSLRAYQAGAIIRVRDAFADGARRIMCQAPTGGGKTRIASTITRGVCDIHRPVLFVVPAIELVDQTLEKFAAEGITDVGVIQAQHRMTDRSRPVQIASIQTLARRELPPADLVFIDEAHKLFKFYPRWMLDLAWRDVLFIGLSATPWTKGLGGLYEKLIVAATPQRLIDDRYLSDFKVFAPAHPDLKGVRTQAGDYKVDDLGEVMDKPPLVADVATTWLKHGLGRPTLCFAVNRVHAQHLADQFAEHGVRAGYIDHYTPANERREIREFTAVNTRWSATSRCSPTAWTGMSVA